MGTTFFKGTTSIGTVSFNEALEENIVQYINWSLLNIGAFYNIDIPTSGVYGGDYHKLRRISDPRYTDGTVWEGFHKNWVFESGISYATQPVSISGVFINNEFFPINSGYYIDYPNGRVIFDSALPASSSVKLSYSFKWISVVHSEDVPWFREGHTRSFRIDESSYTSGSGIWNQLTDRRIELPCIVIEMTNKNFTPYALGGGQNAFNDVLLHVISEDYSSAARLTNILAEQKHSVLYVYDADLASRSGVYPLDYRGSLNANAKMYPDLILPKSSGGYLYSSKVQNGKIYISDSVEELPTKLTKNIYHGTVTWNVEAILHNI